MTETTASGRRRPRVLSPQTKWEIFLQITAGESTQADAARKWAVDVSTIIGIRRTVKDAALALQRSTRGWVTSPSGEISGPAKSQVRGPVGISTLQGQADRRCTPSSRRVSVSSDIAVIAARAASGRPPIPKIVTNSSRPSRPPRSQDNARSFACGNP